VLNKEIVIPSFSNDECNIRLLDSNLEKLASDNLEAEIEKFLSTYTKKPNHSIILINALGAGEYWGFNNRGDFFPEDQLKIESPLYGYKTFEVFGNLFRGHHNKNFFARDGEVVKALWIDDLKKVYLLVEVFPSGEDLIEKLEQRIPVSVSMGCRVLYEVCSYCMKKIEKFSERCEHLLYRMGETLPDGSQIYAVNYYPIFFDISEVRSGADKTAYVLKKVASDKVAQEFKEIPSNVVAPVQVEPSAIRKYIDEITARELPIPPQFENVISEFPPEESLGALSSLGIVLSPDEFKRYYKIFPGIEEDYPVELLKILHPLANLRSVYRPFISGRIRIIVKRIPSNVEESKDIEYLKYRVSLMRLLQKLFSRFFNLMPLFGASSVEIGPLSDNYIKTAYLPYKFGFDEPKPLDFEDENIIQYILDKIT